MNTINKKQQSRLFILFATIINSAITVPLLATPFNCSTDAYIVHSTPDLIPMCIEQ